MTKSEFAETKGYGGNLLHTADVVYVNMLYDLYKLDIKDLHGYYNLENHLWNYVCNNDKIWPPTKISDKKFYEMLELR